MRIDERKVAGFFFGLSVTLAGVGFLAKNYYNRRPVNIEQDVSTIYDKPREQR